MIPSKASTTMLLASLSGLTMVLADAEYCTFYTENFCSQRSGSVSYDIHNGGIFQNGGPYMKCAASSEFSLISYPPGDSSGSSPHHCHVFPYGSVEGCVRLPDLGYTTGDGGYYRFSLSKTCPSGTTKRDADALASTTTNHTLDARAAQKAADYLHFCDDPGCEQQSGGVVYSTGNQGCFNNGGAYGFFPGTDTDWHIEQWSGTGDYNCAVQRTNCITSAAFTGGGCKNLRSAGLNPGFGSYKIGRGGCP